ncbi:MAG TPA: ABC transporter permease [Gemmatimonadaceae bacterium]|nr:ABC transporter permease [Gemmatimonadaceae bacterium]
MPSRPGRTPHRIGRVGRQLRALFWKSPVAEEVSAELAFHIEMLTRQYIAAGMTPDEARATALARFGDRSRIEAACRDIATGMERDMRFTEYLSELRQDAAYSLRQLRRYPGFTAAAVLMLALGVGATTAMFSVVHAVVLAPLPFPHPDRVVRIYETNPNTDSFSSSDPNYLDWRAQSRTLESLAAFRGASRALTGDGDPRRLAGISVTESFFDLIGARIAYGRVFGEEEYRPEGSRDVVLVSDGLWRSEFGADPRVVGRSIQLDGRSMTVIGVLTADFAFGETDILLPLVADPNSSRGNHTLSTIGRLRPGITLAEAQAELSGIAGRLAEEYPESNKDWGVRLESAQDWLIGPEFTRRLYVLQGAVAFVLLLACANVANLLLARAVARQRELGVRAALGAGRGRLVRQLVTESSVLALAGGVAGLLLAYGGVALLRRLDPSNIPRVDEVGVSTVVLVFAFIVSLVTGVIFGAVPALHATRGNLHDLLKTGVRVAGGAHRLRGTLVVTQIAVAMVLLVGAGLLVRSFARLQGVSPGYDVQNVLTGRITLPDGSYPPDRIPEFQRQFIERLSAIPGVQAAATSNIAPLVGGSTGIDFQIDGEGIDAPFRSASWRSVTPDYFRTMRIPLLLGRGIQQTDDTTRPNIVVINQSLAKQLWPNESPLGKRIRVNGPPEPWTVVGVVGDIKDIELAEPQDVMFLSNRQVQVRSLAFMVRTSGDPTSVAAAVRRELRSIDRTIPIRDLQPLAENLRTSLAVPRFSTLMLSLFAVVALGLAALGIYAVMAFSVAQRTREIGVRIALGAKPGRVVRHVVRGGVVLTAVGIVLGTAGAVALTKVLAGLLFGVEATDAPTYVAVAFLLSAVALAASVIPARRAARVDPLVALRSE